MFCQIVYPLFITYKQTKHEQIRDTVSTPLHSSSLEESGDCGLPLYIGNTAGGVGHSSRRCCSSSISTCDTHILKSLIRIKVVVRQRAEADHLTVALGVAYPPQIVYPPKIVYPPGPIERRANTIPRGTVFGGGGFIRAAAQPPYHTITFPQFSTDTMLKGTYYEIQTSDYYDDDLHAMASEVGDMCTIDHLLRTFGLGRYQRFVIVVIILQQIVLGLQIFSSMRTASAGACADAAATANATANTTIAEEWRAACVTPWMPELARAASLTGAVLGAGVCGILCDHWGRKRVFFAALAGCCLFGLGASLAPTYALHVALRLAAGAAYGGWGLTSFVMLMELAHAKYNAVLGGLAAASALTGGVWVPLLAWAIPSWRVLLAVASGTALPFWLFLIGSSESPPWLMVRGRPADAHRVLNKMSIFNGRGPVEGALLVPDKFDTATDAFCACAGLQNVGVLTATLMYLWGCLGFLGAAPGPSPAVTPNREWDRVLFAAAAAGGGLAAAPLLNRLGRRPALSLALLAAGGCCLAGGVEAGHWAGAAVVALLGRLALGACAAVLAVWTAELFPTSARARGLGLCLQPVGLGALVPLALLLSPVAPPSPAVRALVVGAAGVLGSALALTLRETLEAPVLNTMAELEWLTIQPQAAEERDSFDNEPVALPDLISTASMPLSDDLSLKASPTESEG